MAAQRHPPPLHFTTDADGFQTLLALSPGDQPQQLETAALMAQSLLYVDTPAFDLLRHGVAVTVQPHKEKFLVTVHPLAPGGFDGCNNQAEGRLSVEALLPTMKKALNPARWPDKLAAALPQKRVTGHKFKPVALLQVVNHRRQIELPAQGKGKEGSSIVATLDESAVLIPDAMQDPFTTAPSTAAVTHLYDVRIDEALTGQQSSALTNQLQGLVTLTAVEESCLVRALRAIHTHVPAAAATGEGIHPTMPMAEACRLLLYEQLMQMICNEAGVRYSEEIEHVHQMRVAIRRLRAAANLFGQPSQRKVLRPYIKAIRKVGKLLGAVRDRDVAIAKAQKSKARRATGKQIELWQAQRDEAHAALVAWLDSTAYRQFLVDFYTYCASPPSAHEDGAEGLIGVDGVAVQPQQVRHLVPTLIMERFAAVRAYETLLVKDAVTPYATLHALRIQCKYLRYTVEFTHHLLGSAIDPLLQQLKLLQELLGDLNDAVVATQMLEAEQSAHPTKKQRTYLHQQQELIATLRADVPQAFAEVVGYDSRRALGEAVAKL